MAEDGAEHQPKAETLNLVVRDQAGGEVQFKVKPNTKFGKIFTAYCSRKGVAQDSIRFIFDSERLRDDQSPTSVDMEDGDVIDAVIEQVGGVTASTTSSSSMYG